MNDRTRLATAVAICFAAVTVVGCDEPPPEKAERVRAIKPYYASPTRRAATCGAIPAR
jgi:hypothetical protein